MRRYARRRRYAALAASAGRYEYIRDPRVTVLSDVDNSAVDVQAVSRMGGCETGGAPQLTALAEIVYFVHCYKQAMKIFREPIPSSL